MRLLQRAQLDRYILVAVVLAFVEKAIRRQTGANALESVDEDVARTIVINLVIFHLVGRYAAADADIEPAVAEMIEHANFLGPSRIRFTERATAPR